MRIRGSIRFGIVALLQIKQPPTLRLEALTDHKVALKHCYLSRSCSYGAYIVVTVVMDAESSIKAVVVSKHSFCTLVRSYQGISPHQLGPILPEEMGQLMDYEQKPTGK